MPHNRRQPVMISDTRYKSQKGARVSIVLMRTAAACPDV